MALGWSGSNGGISVIAEKKFQGVNLAERPMEVSYFVNNICNLKCRHCYVGYENNKDELSIDEWISVFDKLIEKGALTFGNVGKEPLLSPEKTIRLLEYFQKKRETIKKLRYGFVTNGILLKGHLLEEIASAEPTYMDVSLDGSEREHDYIRGEGNYEKTVNNLENIAEKYPYLAKRIFISFTLMNTNKGAIAELVNRIYDIGLRNILISPYVPAQNSDDALAIKNNDVAKIYKRIIKNQLIDFSKLENMTVLLKSDYDSQKPLMDRLVKENVINISRLFIDEYGVIFNKYPQPNNSSVVVNYIPFSETLTRAIRISHDGYVGGCLEMFYKDYPKRAKGNIRKTDIEKIVVQ